MEEYCGFAKVYDLFMDNVPYDEWCEYVCTILKEQNILDGLILDLGCGTGKFTRRLAQKGYDMIGIDRSGEMLEIAMEKETGRENILYLNQDMREFELYGTVKAIVSICDSMNYIMEEEDLLKVFLLANNYLDPGGLFLFDMNTVYKYEQILGTQTICENREEGSFIWENYYDSTDRVNEYDLTLYIDDGDNRYKRFEEVHYQRGYTKETIISLLEQAGLEVLGIYEEGSKNAPKEDSERIYFLAKEKQKSQ